jgi:hypothetical protein
MDFQQELAEIAGNKELARPDRSSFQKFFYEVGAHRLSTHLPSSILDDDSFEWEKELKRQNEDQKDQFNLNAINATIINHEFDPKDYLTSLRSVNEENDDSDFLPLFINNNTPKDKNGKPSASDKKGSPKKIDDKKKR